MRKSYNYEKIELFSAFVKKKIARGLLDPDNFWLDPDADPGSMNTDPKHWQGCKAPPVVAQSKLVL